MPVRDHTFVATEHVKYVSALLHRCQEKFH